MPGRFCLRTGAVTLLISIATTASAQIFRQELARQEKNFANNLAFIRDSINSPRRLQIMDVFFFEIERDSVVRFMNSTPEHLRSNKHFQRITEKLNRDSMLAKGRPFPDFAGLSISGDSTSAFRELGSSRFALIDFWSSSCLVCRENVEPIKTLFSHFEPSELQILGISLDSKQSDWIKAITKDSTLQWRHLRYPLSTTSIPVSSTPRYFLIDSNGTTRGVYGATYYALLSMRRDLEMMLVE